MTPPIELETRGGHDVPCKHFSSLSSIEPFSSLHSPALASSSSSSLTHKHTHTHTHTTTKKNTYIKLIIKRKKQHSSSIELLEWYFQGPLAATSSMLLQCYFQLQLSVPVDFLTGPETTEGTRHKRENRVGRKGKNQIAPVDQFLPLENHQ